MRERGARKLALARRLDSTPLRAAAPRPRPSPPVGAAAAPPLGDADRDADPRSLCRLCAARPEAAPLRAARQAAGRRGARHADPRDPGGDSSASGREGPFDAAADGAPPGARPRRLRRVCRFPRDRGALVAALRAHRPLVRDGGSGARGRRPSAPSKAGARWRSRPISSSSPAPTASTASPTARLAIIDYKTGTPPSVDEVLSLAPQLLLEALIAEAGGFENIPAGGVARLEYYHLSGRGEGGVVHPRGFRAAGRGKAAGDAAGSDRHDRTASQGAGRALSR